MLLDKNWAWMFVTAAASYVLNTRLWNEHLTKFVLDFVFNFKIHYSFCTREWSTTWAWATVAKLICTWAASTTPRMGAAHGQLFAALLSSYCRIPTRSFIQVCRSCNNRFSIMLQTLADFEPRSTVSLNHNSHCINVSQDWLARCRACSIMYESETKRKHPCESQWKQTIACGYMGRWWTLLMANWGATHFKHCPCTVFSCLALTPKHFNAPSQAAHLAISKFSKSKPIALKACK